MLPATGEFIRRLATVQGTKKPRAIQMLPILQCRFMHDCQHMSYAQGGLEFLGDSNPLPTCLLGDAFERASSLTVLLSSRMLLSFLPPSTPMRSRLRPSSLACSATIWRTLSTWGFLSDAEISRKSRLPRYVPYRHELGEHISLGAYSMAQRLTRKSFSTLYSRWFFRPPIPANWRSMSEISARFAGE